MKTNEKSATNIHAGHRKRLIDRIYKSGVENTDEIQLTELVLFFCIPRADTNPIAHRLLKEFGSFAGILDADKESLQVVDGVGESTAKMLTLLKGILSEYRKKKNQKNTAISNYKMAKEFFDLLLQDGTEEEFYIACLNSKNEIVSYKILQKGNVNNLVFSMRELTEYVLKNKAISIILGHSHPSGVAIPSFDDIKTTIRIIETMAMINIDVVDHVIVGKTETYSMGAKKDLAHIKDQLRGKYDFLNISSKKSKFEECE